MGAEQESIKEASAKNEKTERELQQRNSQVVDLKSKLQTSISDLGTAMSEFGEKQERMDREKGELNLKVQTLEASLAESKKTADLSASVAAKFVDPATGEQRRCPLILNNGVILSLGVVIDVWVRDSDMGQCNAFRMFKCPVSKSFSMISPFPIIDAFMKLAGSAGVDITSPVVFMYKNADGSWAQFSFHEQLELIARLCSVYRDRKNAQRPPEQRSVNVPGGSFMIAMHSTARGEGFNLECFGMQHDGSGRVEIKTVFDPKWVHPFVGMEFPSGA